MYVCVCAALKDERCRKKKVFPDRSMGEERKRSSRRSWSRTNTKMGAVYCRDGRGGRRQFVWAPYVTRPGPLQRARMVETGAES